MRYCNPILFWMQSWFSSFPIAANQVRFGQSTRFVIVWQAATLAPEESLAIEQLGKQRDLHWSQWRIASHLMSWAADAFRRFHRSIGIWYDQSVGLVISGDTVVLRRIYFTHCTQAQTFSLPTMMIFQMNSSLHHRTWVEFYRDVKLESIGIKQKQPKGINH